MIILIDNYDSFSYNLYQFAGAAALELRGKADIRVIRNDACTAEEIGAMEPDAIIISPGPGRPEDAGVCIDVIQKLSHKIPILGVCLGHQAICKAFGAEVSYAAQLMHGKQSLVDFDESCPVFSGIQAPMKVARYHSLSAVESTLPDCLQVTARSRDGEIMAVKHRDRKVYGLQFHPESVMTPDGMQMIRNFLQCI